MTYSVQFLIKDMVTVTVKADNDEDAKTTALQKIKKRPWHKMGFQYDSGDEAFAGLYIDEVSDEGFEELKF